MNKISEVRQALGENSNSLSILSTSNNVNKWSFHKPIQFNKTTALTDEEINSKNCGFYNFVFNTPFDLIHNIGEVWKYEKPSSYFRLSDFKYYDHNAERWYILEGFNNNNFIRIDLSTDISLFTSFQELKNQDLDFGFLISTTLDNTTTYGYYYKQCNIQDLDGHYHLDASNLPIGTYQVIPVLKSADSRYNNDSLTPINRNSDFVGDWYAFPSQPISIQVVPPITEKLQLSVANSYYALGVDQTGEFIENIEFDLQVSLESGNLYYSIELWFKNAYDGTSVKDIKVGEVSGGGSVNTHNIKYRDRIHYLAGDYDVKFPLTAKITVNGKIEERTITIWK